MATIWTHRESNIRKTWLLITIFLVLVTTIGWVFSQIYGNPGIFIFAFALSIIMSISSYWFSDKIVVAATGAKPLPDKAAPDVHNIVENLAITAGLPKPKIYIVDSPQPNAFATGRNPEHAIVAVTTGILQLMNRTELEGVLAHEMSHIGNRDMLVSTVVVVLVGVIQLLADIFMRSMFWRGNDRDRGGGNGIFLLIGLALAILALIPRCAKQIMLQRTFGSTIHFKERKILFLGSQNFL
jgi:heat shock protein HtpX